MGSSNQHELITEDEIQFYEMVQDHYFGSSSVYVSNKIPLCYIVKLVQNPHHSSIFNLFQKLQDRQSYALINLYGFEIKRTNCCDSMMNQTLISYWAYSNFYFSDYLARRKERNQAFQQGQIWHVIDVCCQASSQFYQYNVFYDFLPQTMVVNLQGKLRIHWAHLKSQNAHLNYFRYFEKQIHDSYYSPEELEQMAGQEKSLKINFKKANTFCLGMLLLYCSTLIDPIQQIYYHSISDHRINITKINNLKEKAFVYYSPTLQQLLKSMLHWDSRQRPTLQEIKEEYKNFMGPQLQLQLFKPKIVKEQQKYKFNTKNFASLSNTEEKTTNKYSRISPLKH